MAPESWILTISSFSLSVQPYSSVQASSESTSRRHFVDSFTYKPQNTLPPSPIKQVLPNLSLRAVVPAHSVLTQLRATGMSDSSPSQENLLHDYFLHLPK